MTRDELRRLLAEATNRGAWKSLTHMTGPTTPTGFGPTVGESCYQRDTGEEVIWHECVGVEMKTLAIVVGDNREKDEALIVAAVNALPSLLDALDAAEKEIASLKAAALPEDAENRMIDPILSAWFGLKPHECNEGEIADARMLASAILRALRGEGGA